MTSNGQNALSVIVKLRMEFRQHVIISTASHVSMAALKELWSPGSFPQFALCVVQMQAAKVLQRAMSMLHR